MSQLEVTNFYGLGNTTPGTPAEFYQVRQQQWLLLPAVAIGDDRRSELSLGPVVQYSVTDSTPDRFVTDSQPYGSGDFGQAGLRFDFAHDGRDQTGNPHRGYLAEPHRHLLPGHLGREQCVRRDHRRRGHVSHHSHPAAIRSWSCEAAPERCSAPIPSRRRPSSAAGARCAHWCPSAMPATRRSPGPPSCGFRWPASRSSFRWMSGSSDSSTPAGSIVDGELAGRVAHRGGRWRLDRRHESGDGHHRHRGQRRRADRGADRHRIELLAPGRHGAAALHLSLRVTIMRFVASAIPAHPGPGGSRVQATGPVDASARGAPAPRRSP